MGQSLDTHHARPRKTDRLCVCVPMGMRERVMDAETCSKLDLGSDHRAVASVFTMSSGPTFPKQKQLTKKKGETSAGHRKTRQITRRHSTNHCKEIFLQLAPLMRSKKRTRNSKT